MTEQLFNLIALVTVAAGIVAIVYLDRPRSGSALNSMCEIRQTMQQILANTQQLERSLHDQRRVLNDAHKRISAVTKGVKKPAQ
jgi:hypothetical protein